MLQLFTKLKLRNFLRNGAFSVIIVLLVVLNGTILFVNSIYRYPKLNTYASNPTIPSNVGAFAFVDNDKVQTTK